MFVYFSKLLPTIIYPISLGCILLLLALLIKTKERFRNTLILVTLLMLFLSGNHWISTALVRSLEWQYLPGDEIPTSDVIVVLGGGTEAEIYPRQSVEVNSAGNRVLYAGQLYKAGIAPNLLLSGGSIGWYDARGENTSPAEEMAEILSWMEIPEEAIWLEPNSLNTYENAEYSAEILQEKGIDQIILVTSAMHMPRSVALFEAQGLTVIPAPTDFSVTQAKWNDLTQASFSTQFIRIFPTASNLSKTTSVLKEYIGMAIYHFKGWL
jgi:uncharacterized SAM-binding protein YcdF (DUF218 family)